MENNKILHFYLNLIIILNIDINFRIELNLKIIKLVRL